MFQGTGSDVGKSLIVAGLARALTLRGLAVRPFKPQNMSNNAAVTCDGGEIGRAQALQARAARTPASVHMNPVLLKPQSEIGAQIVVRGRVYGSAKAAAYQRIKRDLLPVVLESYRQLRSAADIVLVEGAGSAAEINLRANDIANMGFAEAADLPVVLIGDIDRGGVIASLVGTKHVINAPDAARICGFIVNKFRGDPALFAQGMTSIAQATGWSPLGLVPFFPEARLLPAEDALALEQNGAAKPQTRVRIAVPILPHIANFDDLDPLEAEPAVDLIRLRPGTPLPGDADLAILPGSRRCAPSALTSTSPRIAAAAAWCLACVAVIRCWAARLTTRRASRVRQRKSPALVCSRSKPFCPMGSGSSRSAARPLAALRLPVMRCIWASLPGPTVRGHSRDSMARRRARSRPTAACSAHTSTACSPMTVSAPPGSSACRPAHPPSPTTI